MEKKKALSIIMIFIISLTACGKKGAFLENERYNCGRTNIMETEYGYYFNIGLFGSKESLFWGFTQTNSMSLAFHDKETNKNILLCNKPECIHGGDDKCVATYKNISVISTVLYDNYLYVYGVEQNDTLFSFNLYKAALDGSSIDKIGTVFEDVVDTEGQVVFYPKCSLGNESYYFIIHKGNAYLPYYFNIGGHSQYGFKGGGIKKMDITNGKTEDVYSLERGNSPFPANLYADGDRIYFDFKSDFNDYGYQYYDINSKDISHTEWDKAYCEKNGLEIKKFKTYFNVSAENDKYGFVVNVSRINPEPKDDYEQPVDDDYKLMIYAYEKYNLDDKKSFDIEMKLSEMGYQVKDLFIDDDKLIICGQDKIVVYGIGENNWGQYLGSLLYESEITKNNNRPVYERKANVIMDYHYRKGNLYLVTSEVSDAGMISFNKKYNYYICPLEKLLKGEGSWEILFVNELN